MFFVNLPCQFLALYAISVDDKYPQKDSVLLMTAGDDNDTTFEQPKRYFRLLKVSAIKGRIPTTPISVFIMPNTPTVRIKTSKPPELFLHWW